MRIRLVVEIHFEVRRNFQRGQAGFTVRRRQFDERMVDRKRVMLVLVHLCPVGNIEMIEGMNGQTGSLNHAEP